MIDTRSRRKLPARFGKKQDVAAACGRRLLYEQPESTLIVRYNATV
jgi:hypothetical protein